jgi:ATP synthase protein I
MVRAVSGAGKSPVFPKASRVSTMSDGARGGGDPGARSADEAALSARLRHLGERLDHVKATKPSANAAPHSPANASGMARGIRLSTELVAGVIVGAAIGWALDRWLGIKPWGFIVFTLLGFVAGILNVMRSAGAMAEREWRKK